jgi:hypothetical protein
MPIVLTGGADTRVAVATLITEAFLELNVFGAETVPAPSDMAFALGKLNRILDNLNAERQAVYQQLTASFPLTPSLSPHTIGPTGTWVTPQRPVSIDEAALFVSPTVKIPMEIHDYRWYMRLSVPLLTSTFPTDLYYQPDWPNGSLFFWPVGTGAQTVELVARVVVGQVALADDFWMPPGYRDLVTLTLAAALAGPYRKALTPTQIQDVVEARARVYGNNLIVPKVRTHDEGMPGGRRTAARGTYLTGWR